MYICEICGNRSQNREEVEKCEKQGKNPKFSKDQKVVFGYGHPVREMIIVSIDRAISYREETHLPIYTVNFPPEFPELRRAIDSVPEDWLQPVPSYP